MTSSNINEDRSITLEIPSNVNPEDVVVETRYIDGEVSQVNLLIEDPMVGLKNDTLIASSIPTPEGWRTFGQDWGSRILEEITINRTSVLEDIYEEMV